MNSEVSIIIPVYNAEKCISETLNSILNSSMHELEVICVNDCSTDNSLKGIKTMYKNDPEKALKIADEIIKNTYRTLMTRGQKGCYVYCEDKALANYLRNRINQSNNSYLDDLMVAEEE